MHQILLEGIQLYNEKRYQDALVSFLHVSSEDPEINFDLVYYIGLCYARLLQYDDALVYLEQIVTAGADIARIYQCRLILAFIYTETDRLKLAEFELSKLVEAGYESAQVYSSLAYLSYEQGDTEKAIELYEKALNFFPENTTALNGLGYVLADSDTDMDRALQLCSKAAELDQDNVAYIDSLAWVYYKLGRIGVASRHMKLAIEKCSDNELMNYHAQMIYSAQKG